MIPEKPPELGNKNPENWIREYLGWCESLRFEFRRVVTLWLPVSGNDFHGRYPAEQITAGNSAYISAVIPRSVNKIKEAVIRFIPSTSGIIDWTASINYAAVDDDESLNERGITADGLRVIDDSITEVDVTSIFSQVQRDDQCGIKFTLDAATTTTDVYVLGLYLKFN